MRKVIAAAVVVGAIAAPASVLAGKPTEPKQKKCPVVSVVIRGAVDGVATETSVPVKVWRRGSNRFGRAFWKETITLDIEKAKLRGFIMVNDRKRWAPESYTDLKDGDRVKILTRAPKCKVIKHGDQVPDPADLRPVRWIKDYNGFVKPVDETPLPAPVAVEPTV